ncbi:MinD/ParA family protein [Virgibacillus halodenitrificans]|uniref:MinD/ParA family protein n=1 Tax=Virgibacillus halodenitrificans TaxID=1482 RepID=UPI001F2FD474|nr:MinD/ParA family protein [Virgibacillus halodenitrificans]MCG1028719.1 MinD/ParA family protein [Virgibacillus halodenitrificans]
MNDQASELRRRLNKSKDEHEAKTISIISGKGGVGKSNVALNFSLELLIQKKSVLIIDLDIGMGNINILLGVDPRKTIIDMFKEQLSIFDIIEQGPCNLSYIAAGSGLADFFTMNDKNRNYFYKQFTRVVSEYDYIIFDMGAGVTSDSIFFMLASDECILVTTPEPTSITDGYSMIKHIVAYNSDLPISIIMNRAQNERDGQNAAAKFTDVIKQFLNKQVRILGILPEDKHVSNAVRRQTPYLLLNERAPVSKAIKKITRTYIQCVTEEYNKPSSSFVRKLKQLILER